VPGSDESEPLFFGINERLALIWSDLVNREYLWNSCKPVPAKRAILTRPRHIVLAAKYVTYQERLAHRSLFTKPHCIFTLPTKGDQTCISGVKPTCIKVEGPKM